MATLRDSDFPALGTDAPAEELITVRFRWYHRQANRARIAYRGLGTVQLVAALIIASRPRSTPPPGSLPRSAA